MPEDDELRALLADGCLHRRAEPNFLLGRILLSPSSNSSVLPFHADLPESILFASNHALLKSFVGRKVPNRDILFSVLGLGRIRDFLPTQGRMSGVYSDKAVPIYVFSFNFLYYCFVFTILQKIGNPMFVWISHCHGLFFRYLTWSVSFFLLWFSIWGRGTQLSRNVMEKKWNQIVGLKRIFVFCRVSIVFCRGIRISLIMFDVFLVGLAAAQSLQTRPLFKQTQDLNTPLPLHGHHDGIVQICGWKCDRVHRKKRHFGQSWRTQNQHRCKLSLYRLSQIPIFVRLLSLRLSTFVFTVVKSTTASYLKKLQCLSSDCTRHHRHAPCGFWVPRNERKWTPRITSKCATALGRLSSTKQSSLGLGSVDLHAMMVHIFAGLTTVLPCSCNMPLLVGYPQFVSEAFSVHLERKQMGKFCKNLVSCVKLYMKHIKGSTIFLKLHRQFASWRLSEQHSSVQFLVGCHCGSPARFSHFWKIVSNWS